MGVHVAETTGVPAITAAVTALTSLIAQVDALGTAQESPLTGIAADKEVARTTLEEATFLVSEALGALAAGANNNTLLAEVELSRAEMVRHWMKFATTKREKSP